MKRKILFLVHIEEMFDRHFAPGYREDLHKISNDYDEIIALTSWVDDTEPIWEVKAQITDDWEWSWGYEPQNCPSNITVESYVCDCMTCKEAKHIILSAGHEWTYIPEELRDNLPKFQAADIHVGGGYDGECLSDWLSVLDHVGLDYEVERELVYP